MPNPPRRARFQIHLSTAIVMMFVAGGVIWANTRANTLSRNDKYISLIEKETTRIYVSEIEFQKIVGGDFEIISDPKGYGWPLTMVRILGVKSKKFPSISKSVFFVESVFDTFIAFLILFSIWMICESLIRRRLLKKGA